VDLDQHARRGRRWGLVFGTAYLVFLIGPSLAEAQSRRPAASVVPALAAVALFVAVDLWFWATQAYERPVRKRSVAALAVMCAITVGLTIHDAGWVWCFIYCGIAAGATSWNRRLSIALVVTVLAQLLVIGLVDPATRDFLPSLVVIVLTGGIGMVGIGRLIETNHQLREAREEVGRLAVAEERLRFARDLHDLLGHSLSVIVLKSELAGRLSAASPDRAAQEIGDVERVAREALREVREAVAGYRQPGLGQELESAGITLRAAGIDARLQPLAVALSTPLDSTLAWALREGVTNVLRHSRAHEVDLRVERTDDHVSLELLDDGVGCAGGGQGNGLRGLRERVAAREGTLVAGPRPEGGFRLAVTLPLRDLPQQDVPQQDVPQQDVPQQDVPRRAVAAPGACAES
jgi:two-component system sensor histidine kinase DesK